MDVGVGLAEGAADGHLLGPQASQQYVEEVLSDPDRTNDFRLLERELT